MHHYGIKIQKKILGRGREGALSPLQTPPPLRRLDLVPPFSLLWIRPWILHTFTRTIQGDGLKLYEIFFYETSYTVVNYSCLKLYGIFYDFQQAHPCARNKVFWRQDVKICATSRSVGDSLDCGRQEEQKKLAKKQRVFKVAHMERRNPDQISEFNFTQRYRYPDKITCADFCDYQC